MIARASDRGRPAKGLETVGPSGGRRELRLFMVAGEHSGDALGGRLMAALNTRCEGAVRYFGVGGEHMQQQGLGSQFPLSDVAVMGPLSILPRLPRIVRRVYRTVSAAIAAEPDAVVIIDAPELTHPIATRIRRRRPRIPIIDYVSPSVWAWRPGRARRMRAYIDHVMALLPFEPEAHRRLGGPPCTYVGHPLIERMGEITAPGAEALAVRLGLDPTRPVLIVLPGSRSSEIGRLMTPFGQAVELLGRENGVEPEVIIPAAPRLRHQIEGELGSWRIRPHVIEGERDKFHAFRLARAALAASGTVTLELGLAGTPMVVAYRVDAIAARLKFLVDVPSIVLANLVLGERAFPELVQEECRPDRLATALAAVMHEGPERQRQLAALKRIPERMHLAAGTPSEAAADIVLSLAAKGRGTTL